MSMVPVVKNIRLFGMIHKKNVFAKPKMEQCAKKIVAQMVKRVVTIIVAR